VRIDNVSKSGELNPGDLLEILPTFQRLSPNERARLLQTIATFFGIEGRTNVQATESARREITGSVSESNGSFSQDRSISPKEFIVQKDPRTDIERVACLAYYLTHYRDMPHFKTIDLSKLNTEAAQPKFSIL
jgi:hypothetical protein